MGSNPLANLIHHGFELAWVGKNTVFLNVGQTKLG